MRMCDFVVRDAIVPNLNAASKEGVIRTMVESLRDAGQFRGADLEDILRAILRRELLGSTGIGKGIAIPHTKHPSVERLVGTIAVSPNGVAFDSLDGEPVYIFVMLISPQDRPGDHLRALENVSRCLRKEDCVRGLVSARTLNASCARFDVFELCPTDLLSL